MVHMKPHVADSLSASRATNSPGRDGRRAPCDDRPGRTRWFRHILSRSRGGHRAGARRRVFRNVSALSRGLEGAVPRPLPSLRIATVHPRSKSGFLPWSRNAAWPTSATAKRPMTLYTVGVRTTASSLLTHGCARVLSRLMSSRRRPQQEGSQRVVYEP